MADRQHPSVGSDNLLTDRYRGSDPSHRDDVGLRLAMQRKAPLVYFHGVEVRQDILGEADGPMLRFGLQGFHLQALHAPRARELRPSAEFLAERFGLFRKAG